MAQTSGKRPIMEAAERGAVASANASTVAAGSPSSTVASATTGSLHQTFQLMARLMSQMQDATLAIERKTQRTDEAVCALAECVKLQNKRMHDLEQRIVRVEWKLDDKDTVEKRNEMGDVYTPIQDLHFVKLVSSGVQVTLDEGCITPVAETEDPCSMEFTKSSPSNQTLNEDEDSMRTQDSLKMPVVQIVQTERVSSSASECASTVRPTPPLTPPPLPSASEAPPERVPNPCLKKDKRDGVLKTSPKNRERNSCVSLSAPSPVTSVIALEQKPEHVFSPRSDTFLATTKKKSKGKLRKCGSNLNAKSASALRRALDEDKMDFTTEEIRPVSCVMGGEPTVLDGKQREMLSRRLLKAAQMGRVKDVRLLLAEGADVNYFNSWHWTALHWAAMKAHPAVITVLLGHGAHVNVRTSLGNIPLHMAAYNDRKGKCAGLLLDAGSNVDVWNQFGRTPLHLAAECGNEAVVKVLVGAGASKTATDAEGRTPFHVAKTNSIRRFLTF